MRFANRISRRIVAQALMDAVLIVLANGAAYLLRYDEQRTTDQVTYMESVVPLLPLLVGLRLVALYLLDLYKIHWRYVSIHDVKRLAIATSASSFLFWLATLLLGRRDYSWGMQIIDWGMTVFLLSFVRVGYRQVSDFRAGLGDRPTQRALIVGAGDAGEAVARDLLRRLREGIVPVAFVDDDPHKRRLRIHGIPVLGTTHEIASVCSDQQVSVIIIAIPSAAGKTIRDIVGRCERVHRARLCIVPSVPEMLNSPTGTPLPVRDINIEDLLRRKPVQIDMEEVAKYIAGQRVLVTGAGGSIGSELCRQICALNPARLLLVGQGENSIFEIEQELIRDFNFAATALIGDVKDRERLEQIFLHERPTVVFHAAAHKHVPLMEANPQEAVKNNVLGTRNLAELAVQCGVKKFIYVSTDKAVNPTSVMGATKRIGEMIVQSFSQRRASTGAAAAVAAPPAEFAVVRFGNVLGSRGSVIPVMRKQIARGGPVTVTHPEMTRYFMTIPEAVQLILQAGAMGKQGEIYILDMGEPVRILDLARDLIRLSGFRPNEDIPIEFTGTRPGEKIFEELTYSEEHMGRTAHEKIFVSTASTLDAPAVLRDVDHLIRLATEGERDSLREEILRLASNGFCKEEAAGGDGVNEALPPPVPRRGALPPDDAPPAPNPGETSHR